VIVTFVPKMRLTIVDLPTFGRPTTATKPDRKLGGELGESEESGESEGPVEPEGAVKKPARPER